MLALIVVTAFAAIMTGCVTYVATRTAPSPLPTIAPPPLPDYEQPACPGPGYLWIPGYWAYGPEGYFFRSRMSALPPSVGWMWRCPVTGAGQMGFISGTPDTGEVKSGFTAKSTTAAVIRVPVTMAGMEREQLLLQHCCNQRDCRGCS